MNFTEACKIGRGARKRRPCAAVRLSCPPFAAADENAAFRIKNVPEDKIRTVDAENTQGRDTDGRAAKRRRSQTPAVPFPLTEKIIIF